jgi:hypothetical protein
MQTESKTCTKCKTELPMSEFSTYISRSRGLRRRSACKKCEYLRFTNYNSRNREKKRETGRKQREKKYLAGGDILLRYLIHGRLGGYRQTTVSQHLPKMDIDVSYLLELFRSQNGKCYYSGVDLIFGHRKGSQQPDSFSLDRKYPEKGYVKGNVVYCSNLVNTAKGNQTVEEFKDLISKLNNKSGDWQ